MLDYEVFKPIRNLGLLLFGAGALGVLCHLAFMKDPEYLFIAQVFVLLVSSFHLFIGINIITRSRIGFRSLKLYLYLIYPGFPIGYYYAKRTFEYIETHKIEIFFRQCEWSGFSDAKKLKLMKLYNGCIAVNNTPVRSCDPCFFERYDILL